MGKEQLDRSGWKEKVGVWTRNGGIVAGLIGLLVSENLAVLGFLAAVGGEILRRSQQRARLKPVT